MADWQPIETAPKDGTDILVFCRDTQEQMVAFWRGGWQFAVHPNGRVFCSPSDWMPLPEPPEVLMTERKKMWTDGPWYRDRHGRLCSDYGDDPDNRVVIPGIATIVGTTKQQELVANAHLIVAAPELVEALEGLVEVIQMDDPDWWKEKDPRAEKTRIALAKAYGETNND